MELINEPLLESVLIHYINYDEIKTEKFKMIYLKIFS